MAGIPWTPAELAYLEDNWGSFKSEHQEKIFLYRLEEVSGNRRTGEAADNMALKLGLTKRSSVGLPTLGEMARELNVRPDTLQKFIAKRQLKVIKTRNFVFIPEETQEVLEQFYTRPPKTFLEGSVTTAEAAERLHVVQKEITRLIQFGVLEGIKVRGKWQITKHSLYRAMSLRNIHGNRWLSKLSDKLTEAYQENRALAREHRRQSRMLPKTTHGHATVFVAAPVKLDSSRS